MSDKVIDILKYSSEGHSIDFKRDQYPIEKHGKKHEILKDISAMANHPSNEDKYIIIGVKEKNGVASEFYDINELIDQATYQQYLDSNIEPKINFEYKSFIYDDHQLAYFRIFDNNDRPYLIKKAVQNSSDKNKIEFKEGDGFIRVGTSTDKMTRHDFDNIYKSKYELTDRKSDLIITPYFGLSDTEELKQLKLRFFDIQIENTSNRSIDLDVEMKIFRADNYKIVPERTILEEFDKHHSTQQYSGLGFRMPHISGMRSINFHIDVDELSDYIFIKRTKLRQQKFALNIPQKSYEKDIFYQGLVLIGESSGSIKAELVIRSDDFSSGVLRQMIELKIDNN